MAVLRTVAEEISVRRLVTAVVVAAMMVLSGCGRQVTGLNQPSSGVFVPPGQTSIRFETNGPLDFQNLTYLIVLNTSGNGLQPYAQGYNTDFRNWSAFFIVGGGAGYVSTPGLLQVYQDPSSGAARTFGVQIPIGTLTFQTTIPQANVQYGFQITFNRCILDFPPPSTSPPPLCALGTGPPFLYIGQTWAISLFTLDRTGSPVDSLGTTGPSDTSYNFSIDTSQVVATNKFKPASGSTTQTPSQQIIGIEVFSSPSNNPPKVTPSPTPSPTPTH